MIMKEDIDKSNVGRRTVKRTRRWSSMDTPSKMMHEKPWRGARGRGDRGSRLDDDETRRKSLEAQSTRWSAKLGSKGTSANVQQRAQAHSDRCRIRIEECLRLTPQGADKMGPRSEVIHEALAEDYREASRGRMQTGDQLEMGSCESTTLPGASSANTRRRIVLKSEPVAVTTQDAVARHCEKAMRIASVEQVELGNIIGNRTSLEECRYAERMDGT